MRELLERHPDLDAVFAANDLMGAGALQVHRGVGPASAGRRRRHRLRRLADRPHRRGRPLSSVRQSLDVMGRELVSLLLADIEAADDVARKVVLAIELVVSESSGGQPTDETLIDIADPTLTSEHRDPRAESRAGLEQEEDRAVRKFVDVSSHRRHRDRSVRRHDDTSSAPSGAAATPAASTERQLQQRAPRLAGRDAARARPPEPAIHRLHGDVQRRVRGRTTRASPSTCRSSHRLISRRSTQTRLAANDVDVVDMFAFDTGRPAVHEGRRPRRSGRRSPTPAACWT